MVHTQQMHFSRTRRWEAGTRLCFFKNNDFSLPEQILPGWQIRSGLPQPQPQATSSAAVRVQSRFLRNDPIKLLNPEMKDPPGQSKLNLKRTLERLGHFTEELFHLLLFSSFPTHIFFFFFFF